MGSDFDLSKLERFEWDKGNLEHIKKHKVNFKECEGVFSNKPLLISEDKKHSEIEERFEVLGITNQGRLIFLVFTIRNNRIRVVSARNQNKKEQKEFQEGGEN